MRELESAIARAVLLETTGVLQAGSLPPQLAASGAAAATLPTDVLPLAETERRAITRALDAAGNNVTRAALALGINRTTLHRKLKKYDLPAAVTG